MPETIEHKKVFSLLEVSQSIQRTLVERYTSAFWVKAEMNKLNYYPHSGHCYPELVEKKDNKVIAQLKATLWRDDYLRINQHFQQVLREPLKDGITILFYARVTFTPMHGLSLSILDIDPVFSLGELEREKQETIRILKEEGIYDKNKSRPLARLPQRLAIISVQTSKGYADFTKVIEQNTWGYRFFYLLFPSLLQGDQAVVSILRQLKRIKKVIHHFDVVAIIRGGGGDVGLSCFNNLDLAREIVQFPIPVITGIGHATNLTVTEMVAYKNAITPTELADFLLQRFHDVAMPLQRAEEVVRNQARQQLKEQKAALRNSTKYFRSLTAHIITRSEHALQDKLNALRQLAAYALRHENEAQVDAAYTLKKSVLAFCGNNQQTVHALARQMKREGTLLLKRKHEEVHQQTRHITINTQRTLQHNQTALTNLERIVQSMDPKNVLKRGYSITQVNGKVVTHTSQIKHGDQLVTILSDGTVLSETISTKKDTDA